MGWCWEVIRNRPVRVSGGGRGQRGCTPGSARPELQCRPASLEDGPRPGRKDRAWPSRGGSSPEGGDAQCFPNDRGGANDRGSTAPQDAGSLVWEREGRPCSAGRQPQCLCSTTEYGQGCPAPLCFSGALAVSCCLNTHCHVHNLCTFPMYL